MKNSLYVVSTTSATLAGQRPSGADLFGHRSKMTPKYAYLSLRWPPKPALTACLGLSCLGLSLGLGFAPDVYAHNCGSALQVLAHPIHCAEHAANETADFVDDEIIKPAGDCIANFEQCAEATASAIRLDAVMTELILRLSREQLSRFGNRLSEMAKIWGDVAVQKSAELQDLAVALANDDIPRASEHLSKLLKHIAATASSKNTYRLALKGLKNESGAESMLLSIYAGGGLVGGGKGGPGLAVDMDYMILAFEDEGDLMNFAATQGEDSVVAQFTATNIGVGLSGGGSVDFGIGFHRKKPADIGGPRVDTTLAAAAYAGAGVTFGFDVVGFPTRPPEFMTASMIVKTGAGVEVSLGGGYLVVKREMCPDWTILRRRTVVSQLLDLDFNFSFKPGEPVVCPLNYPDTVSPVNYGYGYHVWGGKGGYRFNDMTELQKNLLQGQVRKVVRIGLRAGSRVDQVSIEYDNGVKVTHGGSGGSAQSLAWADGLNLMQAEVCKKYTSKYDSTTVHYLKFTLRNGYSIAGGTRTGECVTLKSDLGYPIRGFRGRSGSEVDSFGVIFERPPAANL